MFPSAGASTAPAAVASSSAPGAGALPPGWTAYTDPATSRPYYVNGATGATQWTPPQPQPHPAAQPHLRPPQSQSQPQPRRPASVPALSPAGPSAPPVRQSSVVTLQSIQPAPAQLVVQNQNNNFQKDYRHTTPPQARAAQAQYGTAPLQAAPFQPQQTYGVPPQRTVPFQQQQPPQQHQPQQQRNYGAPSQSQVHGAPFRPHQHQPQQQQQQQQFQSLQQQPPHLRQQALLTPHAAPFQPQQQQQQPQHQQHFQPGGHPATAMTPNQGYGAPPQGQATPVTPVAAPFQQPQYLNNNNFSNNGNNFNNFSGRGRGGGGGRSNAGRSYYNQRQNQGMGAMNGGPLPPPGLAAGGGGRGHPQQQPWQTKRPYHRNDHVHYGGSQHHGQFPPSKRSCVQHVAAIPGQPPPERSRCAQCHTIKERASYSKTQWSQHWRERKCRTCVDANKRANESNMTRESEDKSKKCAECGKVKGYDEYSKRQWGTKETERKCVQCVGKYLVENGFGTREEAEKAAVGAGSATATSTATSAGGEAPMEALATAAEEGAEGGAPRTDPQAKPDIAPAPKFDPGPRPPGPPGRAPRLCATCKTWRPYDLFSKRQLTLKESVRRCKTCVDKDLLENFTKKLKEAPKGDAEEGGGTEGADGPDDGSHGGSVAPPEAPVGSAPGEGGAVAEAETEEIEQEEIKREEVEPTDMAPASAIEAEVPADPVSPVETEALESAKGDEAPAAPVPSSENCGAHADPCASADAGAEDLVERDTNEGAKDLAEAAMEQDVKEEAGVKSKDPIPCVVNGDVAHADPEPRGETYVLDTGEAEAPVDPIASFDGDPKEFFEEVINEDAKKPIVSVNIVTEEAPEEDLNEGMKALGDELKRFAKEVGKEATMDEDAVGADPAYPPARAPKLCSGCGKLCPLQSFSLRLNRCKACVDGDLEAPAEAEGLGPGGPGPDLSAPAAPEGRREVAQMEVKALAVRTESSPQEGTKPVSASGEDDLANPGGTIHKVGNGLETMPLGMELEPYFIETEELQSSSFAHRNSDAGSTNDATESLLKLSVCKEEMEE